MSAIASDLFMDLFRDLFASKVGKIDAAIEAIGSVYTGHDGADFCLEAEDPLIGGDYLCQALLNTDGKEREWSITISVSRTIDGWRANGSFHATFAGGVLTSLRG
jgi:hypothetical protein